MSAAATTPDLQILRHLPHLSEFSAQVDDKGGIFPGRCPTAIGLHETSITASMGDSRGMWGKTRAEARHARCDASLQELDKATR